MPSPQLKDQSLSLMCKQHSRLNYNKGAHTKNTLRAPHSGNQGNYATGLTGHLQHKIILLRLENLAELPNT